MIITQRLYDDGHIKEFDALVCECNARENGFETILDKTAFFPNGGGQLADSGTLNGFKVVDVNEVDGKIIHLTECEFNVGDIVHGVIDWDIRFSRMQNHTGEYIVCGVAHKL